MSTGCQVVNTCRQRDEPHLSDREHHGQKFILAFSAVQQLLAHVDHVDHVVLSDQVAISTTSGGKLLENMENPRKCLCFFMFHVPSEFTVLFQGPAIGTTPWQCNRGPALNPTVHVLWTYPEDDAKA